MQKFKTSFSGYNKTDVNAFVAQVCKEYESILQKLRESTNNIEYLNKELQRYKNLEKTLNDTLLVAQESSANAQKAAIAEGKLIIEDARRNASKIVNNSLIRSQEIEREAEDLQRQVQNYKKRFIALIENQMDEINGFDERL